MVKYLQGALVLAVLLVSGCAMLRKAAEPHPVAGQWGYTLDSPQGVYTGVFSIEESEEGLIGNIEMADSPVGATMAMDELAFDEESMTLTYSFDSGEFGVMSATFTLKGDSLEGLLTVHQFGMDLTFVAERQEAEEQ